MCSNCAHSTYVVHSKVHSALTVFGRMLTSNWCAITGAHFDVLSGILQMNINSPYLLSAPPLTCER